MKYLHASATIGLAAFLSIFVCDLSAADAPPISVTITHKTSEKISFTVQNDSKSIIYYDSDRITGAFRTVAVEVFRNGNWEPSSYVCGNTSPEEKERFSQKQIRPGGSLSSDVDISNEHLNPGEVIRLVTSLQLHGQYVDVLSPSTTF